MQDVIASSGKTSFETIRRSVRKIAMEGYSGSQLLIQVSARETDFAETHDVLLLTLHMNNSYTTISSNILL